MSKAQVIVKCTVVEISYDSIINEGEYQIAATVWANCCLYSRYVVIFTKRLKREHLSLFYSTFAAKLQSLPVKLTTARLVFNFLEFMLM